MNDDHDVQDSIPDDPQLGALYRHTRTETSSTVLDASIKNAARRVARRRRHRWLLSLSSAAVVLLGLSLTFKVIELERPLEETDLSELEEAESKGEASSMPKLLELDRPASSALSPSYQKIPAQDSDTLDTARMRKPSAMPEQALDKEAPPALTIDGAAGESSAVPSRSLADKLETVDPQAEPPDEVKSDPVLWLHYIRELVEKGRNDAAAAQLVGFLAAYPDYPIPDEFDRRFEP